jgi:hypothetical protein
MKKNGHFPVLCESSAFASNGWTPMRPGHPIKLLPLHQHARINPQLALDPGKSGDTFCHYGRMLIAACQVPEKEGLRLPEVESAAVHAGYRYAC